MISEVAQANVFASKLSLRVLSGRSIKFPMRPYRLTRPLRRVRGVEPRACMGAALGEKTTFSSIKKRNIVMSGGATI